MPSGVSHGSAPPADLAAATGSNATLAKLGMRVIPWRPQTYPWRSQTYDSVQSAFEHSSCRRDRRDGSWTWHGSITPRSIPTSEPQSGTETWSNPSTIGAYDNRPKPLNHGPDAGV